MLTHCKINSDDEIEWFEDENDLSVFVVVMTTVQHQLGRSTCVVSDKKHQEAIKKKFRVVGCHTIKCVSQFDVAVETAVTSLRQEMRVIGLKGLSACLNSKRTIPFHTAGLKAIEDCDLNVSAADEDSEGGLR